MLLYRYKTSKSPDTNPGLPRDFKILIEKILPNQKSEDLCPTFAIRKKKSRMLSFGLALGLTNLRKIFVNAVSGHGNAHVWGGGGGGKGATLILSLAF